MLGRYGYVERKIFGMFVSTIPVRFIIDPAMSANDFLDLSLSILERILSIISAVRTQFTKMQTRLAKETHTIFV